MKNSKTNTEQEIQSTIEKTTARMKNIGVWKEEFSESIERYAASLCEYKLLQRRWIESGCPIIENQKYKNGIECEGTNPQYKQMQKLRSELLTTENQLGLTPSGLKKIKDTELKTQRGISKFEQGLQDIQDSIK